MTGLTRTVRRGGWLRQLRDTLLNRLTLIKRGLRP